MNVYFSFETANVQLKFLSSLYESSEIIISLCQFNLYIFLLF